MGRMKKTKTIKLNKEFKRLYYKGKSSVHPLMVTYAQRNRLGMNRIGITVAKKLGTAVIRNRCKRIIREAYRVLESNTSTGWDFVFVARMKTVYAKSTDIYPVMKKQIEHLTSKKATPKANNKLVEDIRSQPR